VRPLPRPHLLLQLLSFSPDDRWLVSIGREPERGLVVWDLPTGQLVAAGRTEGETRDVAWLRGGDTPVFASAGGDGLLVWTLQDR
jgi:WD40 repeat protein